MLSRKAIALALVLSGSIAVEFPAQGFEAAAPVLAQAGQDRKVEADRLLKQGKQQEQTSQYQAALQFYQQALAIYQAIKDRTGEAKALNNLGNAYGSLSQYDKAIEFSQQALLIFQAIKDRNGEASALNNLGSAYDSLSQHDKAIRYYTQALPIFQAVKDRSGEASALNNLGLAYSSLSQYDKAIRYYTQALPIFQAIQNRNGEATALTNLGLAYYSLSQHDKAIRYYTQALPIFQAIQNRNGEASVLDNLGLAYSSLSQYDKAISYYTQALPIFQAIQNRNGEATALANLGTAYFFVSQYDKAIRYYTQALPILQLVKDRNGEAKVLTNLGTAYSFLSQYDKAIRYYTQALPILQLVKDRNGEATALNNLGLAYSSLSQYDKAISYYTQALPILQLVKDRNGEASALNNLGNAYWSLSQSDKAIRYYTQALPIFQAVKDRNGEAKALMNLGTAYSSLSEYDKAIGYFTQALPILQLVKDRNGEAKALTNLGTAYSSLSQYDKAISYYTQALPILQAVKDRAGEGLLFSNLGEFFAKRNDAELAIVFLKQSVSVRETIRQDIRKLPRAAQESYTQSVAGTYRSLADLLIAQGRIGEAQQILERLKLQELNDFTKGTRAAAPIPEVSFNPAETQIKTQHTSLVAFGSKFYTCEQQRCPQYTQLKSQYQNLSKEFSAFVEQIKQHLSDGRLNQIDKSTQDFQTSADRIVTAHPHSLLIYPLVLPDKTRLLWAAKGGVLSKTATCPLGEKALYGKVSEFRKLLLDPRTETQLKVVGKELYDCLIKPMESELTANQIKHLIFVPDRATNYIPMGALFDSKQYLIQRFAVSNILSAGLTDTTDKLKSPQQTAVLALGLSQAAGDFGALPNVEAELGAIVQKPGNTGIYPGDTYLNQAFTKAALEDNIRGHNIIHIATHGEFKPTNPRSSYFLLGTGTPYPIPDIQALRDLKDVHLVVLSACQTGLGGADGLGLEVSGISSFFLGDRDRAKAVMASLWNVDDASTSLLMQQFYKQLATGKMTKAEALQLVQQQFIAGKLTAKDTPNRSPTLIPKGNPQIRQSANGDFSHPYYWAPFILIGNSL